MATYDPQAAATKQDVGMIMDEIGKLYMANERWKNEIIQKVDEKMDEKITASEERMQRYFMVVAEDMRHDFLGAHKDRVEDHEYRIKRLEQETGQRFTLSGSKGKA